MSRHPSTNPVRRTLNWSIETPGESVLSDEGYRITRQPMAVAGWYTAYAPHGGRPLASGQLERCVEACELHLATKGKREFRHERYRVVREALAQGVR